MSFMSVEFVDTNVLIYGHDPEAGRKHELAAALLQRLFEEGRGALSAQVLAEFFSASVKKDSLPEQMAEDIVQELRTWTMHSSQHSDLIAAWRLRQRYQISWRDALIVQSAERVGAEVLWTEDLNHGQQYGQVTVRNPFAEAASA
jgi:predicted nucleic acid-binding protein